MKKSSVTIATELFFLHALILKKAILILQSSTV